MSATKQTAAKTTSERRRAASRANGAKSRGPVTADGKARSARNATTHSFTGSCSLADLTHTLCLFHEDRSAFEATYEALASTYRPANPAETLILQEMATARWRLQRLWLTETALQNKQMSTLEPRAREIQGDRFDAALLLALGFENLADHGRALALLIRYEARLSRQFQRGLAQLEASRALTAEDTEFPVEPSPKNEHQEPTHDEHDATVETTEHTPGNAAAAPVCASAAAPGQSSEVGPGACHGSRSAGSPQPASALPHSDYVDQPAPGSSESAPPGNVPPVTD